MEPDPPVARDERQVGEYSDELHDDGRHVEVPDERGTLLGHVTSYGSRLHVVPGALFLIMSFGWGLQAWGAFRYRPDPSAEIVLGEDRRAGWEALGLGETPEEQSSAEGADR